MYKVVARKSNKARRSAKIRENVFGTAEKPRLSVFRSNKYIYAQLIDDVEGKTLVDVSSEAKKSHTKKNKVEGAKEMGILLAKKATEKGITVVAFDRNGYKYHGRVKSLADAAREGGLKF